MTAAFFGIGRGQQYLGDRNVVSGQRFLPGMGEADLPRGCGGLLLFKRKRAGLQTKMRPSDGDCA